MSESTAMDTTKLKPYEAKVSIIMSRNPTSVDPDYPIDKVVQLFSSVSFHHIPVAENGLLVGILSDRDISTYLAGKTTAQSAADIMSADPITADPDTSIETGSILLLENQISCLPVVSDASKLVGILTWKDLLRYFVYHT